MFKFIISLVAIFVTTMFSTSIVFAERTVEFDTSKLDKGIIKVLYENPEVSKAKLMVCKGEQKQYFDLSNCLIYDSFGLPYGNGEYEIAVYENVYDTRYKRVFEKIVVSEIKREEVLPQAKQVAEVVAKKVDKEEVKVEVKKELKVEAKKEIEKEVKVEPKVQEFNGQSILYTQSIREINFEESVVAVRIAKELTKDAKTDAEKAKIIHKYVTSNISYDFQKIKRLAPGYVPVMDTILAEKKGICYDYASVYAGMLRSVGVQAKMVKGYSSASSVYHAWNEVCLDGRWVTVDTTYDAYMIQNGFNYTFEKVASYYRTVMEI